MGAVPLVVALLTITSPARADTIFSDGFESSDFSAWSQVVTGGDGTAIVQTAIVRTRSLAAQLAESSASGSKAYIRKTFSASQTELTASGDFYVVKEGASGGNMPIFRFLDPSSNRLFSVYRQNATGGSIYVGVGSSHFTTTGKLPLSTWANVAVHVIANGASSTIEVKLNSVLVYTTTTANLGTAGIATLQVGNDTAAQAFNLVADTITVDGGAATMPSPPVNTLPPDISGTPQDGRSLTATTGNWSGAQPIMYALQWRRCGASGANCTDLPRPTAPTYVATSADVGSTLRAAVTATNSAGSSTVVSAATTVVQSQSSPPANTVAPVIAGTAQAGQTLNANQGTWTGTQPMDFTQQWRRCDTNGAACVDIAGATSASYTIATGDVGHVLRVFVTATNSA